MEKNKKKYYRMCLGALEIFQARLRDRLRQVASIAGTFKTRFCRSGTFLQVKHLPIYVYMSFFWPAASLKGQGPRLRRGITSSSQYVDFGPCFQRQLGGRLTKEK